MNQYEMYYGLQVVSGDNKLSSAYEENAHIKGPKVICDYFLQNGIIYVWTISHLGWTPKLNTKWISNLRVYGTLKNVFTLTKYSGVDPTTVTTTACGRESVEWSLSDRKESDIWRTNHLLIKLRDRT